MRTDSWPYDHWQGTTDSTQKGQKEKPRPHTLIGQIARFSLAEEARKRPKNRAFWLQGSDFATRPGVEVRCRSGRERVANQRKTGNSGAIRGPQRLPDRAFLFGAEGISREAGQQMKVRNPLTSLWHC